jgi:NADH-quinone oxidoreductase subunit A
LPDSAFSIDPTVALAIHVALSAGVVALVIGVAALLREKRAGAPPDTAYESGVRPAAPAGPLDVPYFLIAALFVIFDMEAAVLFAWAVVARQVGWAGLIEAAAFIGVLLAALAYLWADGALDWGPKARR